jgi:hypothetical protein
MKLNKASGFKLVILLGILSLAFSGCAHRIRFKPIDATTKEPLVGVSIRWLQFKHRMFSRSGHEGPTNLPPLGQNGIIKIGGLHTWWESEFIFSRPGYSNVYGGYETGVFKNSDFTLGERVTYFPPGPFEDEFILEGKLTSANRSNGCFTIPMHK